MGLSAVGGSTLCLKLFNHKVELKTPFFQRSIWIKSLGSSARSKSAVFLCTYLWVAFLSRRHLLWSQQGKWTLLCPLLHPCFSFPFFFFFCYVLLLGFAYSYQLSENVQNLGCENREKGPSKSLNTFLFSVLARKKSLMFHMVQSSLPKKHRGGKDNKRCICQKYPLSIQEWTKVGL